MPARSMKSCEMHFQKAHLHSFESLSAVDGEGLRCVVFLAGCPLRCAYCHNPDTWTFGEKTIDAPTLLKKILRLRPYMKERGGVTFSGGEPLLQADFLGEMVPLLEEENIPFVLDTSGAPPLTESVKFVLKKCQSVLLDLKFWDDASYLRYTGQGIQAPMETLRFLEKIGKKTVVRTVVVPGINDSKEILSLYFPHLKGLSCISDWELLPFHTLGFFKYENLGIKNPFQEKTALSQAKKDELQAFVRENLHFTCPKGN